MAAILDFGYLQKSKHLNNISGRFLIPQNICLDTLLVRLVCMVRKLWSKYENGGHFGRHLGFWRMPTRNFRGLFISDSTHIPGPILKKSACYQKCPPFGALWPNTTGLQNEFCLWITVRRMQRSRKSVLPHWIRVYLPPLQYTKRVTGVYPQTIVLYPLLPSVVKILIEHISTAAMSWITMTTITSLSMHRLLRSLCFLYALLIAGLCHCQNSWWSYIKWSYGSSESLRL